MKLFVNAHIRYTLLTLCLLLASATLSRAQHTQTLDSPEWLEFKEMVSEFDLLLTVMHALEKDYPGITSDREKMQEMMGEDLQKFYELARTLPQSLPPNIQQLDNFESYSNSDLMAIRYAVNIAQLYDQSIDVNLEFLKRVADQDSIRDIKLATAQFAMMAGRLDLAEQFTTDEVLEASPHFQVSGLLGGMAALYLDANNLDKAREYTIRAVEYLSELQQGEMHEQQQHMLTQQYIGMIAPLMYEIKEAGDAAALDAFVADISAALGEHIRWTDIQAAVNAGMSEIAKDREAIGKAAKAWAEHTWIGIDDLSLEKLKGKVVLVDFFATWCRPCIMAFPYLREWHEKYSEKGLVIVGLTNYQGRYDGQNVKPEEEFAKLRDEFIPKHKIPWPVGVEKNNGRQTMMDYGVQGIPHVVLLDRDGKVRYVKVGAADYQKTERKIQQLLAE